MSIGTVEEEIVDRGSSREVSQVSKNQSGLLNWLNWYNIPIKQSRFVDNILIKQSTHSLSHPFICKLFTRVGFRGGSKWFYTPVFHPLQKILEYFLTYALIPLLSVIFALAQETICIL